MKNVFLLSFLVLLTVLLHSCVVPVTLADRHYQTTSSAIKNYKLKEVMTTTVGEPIVEIASQKVVSWDAYEAVMDYTTPGSGVVSLKTQIKKGDSYEIHGNTPDGVIVKLKSNSNIYEGIEINPFTGIVLGGWIQLSDGRKMIQGEWTTEQLFKKIRAENKVPGDFKYELVYSGMSGNNIKLLYREYNKDLARPAFNQELQYNLDESKNIAFKKLSIEVIKATNSVIEFKVLSDGDVESSNKWTISSS